MCGECNWDEAQTNKIKFRVVSKMLLVKVEEEKEQKKGILITPNQHADHLEAEVLGVGEKVEIPVKKGDKVLIRYHTGQKLTYKDEKGLNRIINEADVLAVLSDS